MDKADTKEILERTNALDTLKWDEDIERWAHESGEPVAAAVLEVCQSNRAIFFAQGPGKLGDDLDSPHS